MLANAVAKAESEVISLPQAPVPIMKSTMKQMIEYFAQKNRPRLDAGLSAYDFINLLGLATYLECPKIITLIQQQLIQKLCHPLYSQEEITKAMVAIRIPDNIRAQIISSVQEYRASQKRDRKSLESGGGKTDCDKPERRLRARKGSSSAEMVKLVRKYGSQTGARIRHVTHPDQSSPDPDSDEEQKFSHIDWDDRLGLGDSQDA